MPVIDLTGKLIGGYVLHEEIGHGGMAVVYRAVQPERIVLKPGAVITRDNLP